MVVQPDGKILLGGTFTTINGQPRNYIARLEPNGSVESTATFNPGIGASARIDTVALQADGKILLGGRFTSVGAKARNRIARLNADGSIENKSTFDPGTGANGVIRSVAVQADGKILLGGEFTSIDGQPRNHVARLNANGRVESTATFDTGIGADNWVYCVAEQADGKILLGGEFISVNGLPRKKLARLHANGSVESTATFDPGYGPDNFINSLTVQTDGKILLGGVFTNVNGLPTHYFARLRANGGVEFTSDFDTGTGADNAVYSVAVQADGRILLAGQFTTVNGATHNRIARLVNDPTTASLTVPNSARVQWARGGAGPEVGLVTFELSTDGGATWSLLGFGTRIPGGWERTALSLPVSGSVRARGRAVGGIYSGSSGLVENVAAFTTTLTPIAVWKLTNLADPTAPDLGDPDGDGMETLLEYGLGFPPGTASAPLAVTSFVYVDGERLRVFVQRDPARNDVNLEVQSANTMAGPWTTVATSSLGTPFTGPGYVGGDSATPGVKTVEVRDTVNVTAVSGRVLRVRVSR